MEDWRKEQRQSQRILNYCVFIWMGVGFLMLIDAIIRQSVGNIILSFMVLLYPLLLFLISKNDEFLSKKMDAIDAFWKTKKGQIIQNWIYSPIMLLGLVFIGSQDERVMSIIRTIVSFF